VQDSAVVYVVECSFRTKDKLRIFNARTFTRLRKLWVSNHSWNSESLSTASPPLRHALEKARRMSMAYVLRNINRIMLSSDLCGLQNGHLLSAACSTVSGDHISKAG
jgi:hypothetical protein